MSQPIIVRYKEEDLLKSDRWVLVYSVTFLTIVGEIKITVPHGYATDFASVPMVLWGLFPPINKSNRAFLLHDWWYDNRLFEETYGAKEARLMADQELYNRLQEIEPDKPIRNFCIYQACRWFGKSWWDN